VANPSRHDGGPTPEEAAHRTLRLLDRSLFSGIAWTVVFRWAAQAVSWAATLYVVRVLSPGDYGLVAMATVPIGLARLVEDLGLDAVIVQNRRLSENQLASLAGSALCLGTTLTIAFILLAAPIALYFREPDVAALVIAMSLTFMTDSLQVLPRALLQKDLAFRTLGWLHAAQVTIAAAVLTVCAALSFGHWALVLNNLVSAAAITAVLFALRPFRIAWPRQLGTIAGSLVAGWRMVVSRAAWYGYTSLDSTVIGRALGKEPLGAFSFAMTFALLPVTEVSQMVSKVVPGIFSSVQEDRSNLRRYFLMLTEAVSYLALPMSVGLALTADDFVLLALGPKWVGVVVPLRILCAYAAINASQMLVSHVLLWTGHFRANMWFNLFALALLPTCFYIGVHWGVSGVAWAWVVGFPLSIVPSVMMMARILELPTAAYLKALRPALTASAVMVVAVLLLREALPPGWSHGMRLAAQGTAGALVYTVVMLTLFSRSVLAIYRTIRDARRG
jgi:O-antigen/teichoic acid export membrane protein